MIPSRTLVAAAPPYSNLEDLLTGDEVATSRLAASRQVP